MNIEVINSPLLSTFGELNNGLLFMKPGDKQLYLKSLSFGDPSGQFNTVVVGTGQRLGMSGPTKIVPVKNITIQL